MTAFQATQKALPCLETLLISKDTHTLYMSPPPSTTLVVVNQVWLSKGAIYLFTGIHFYGFFQPTLFTQFFLILNQEKEALILYSIKVFSTYFQMASALEASKEYVSNILFLITEHYRICGGRMERMVGLARS